MTLTRSLYAGLLLGAVVLLGYRVLARADHGDRALPADPVERLELAPLDGDAFGDLALASQSAGNTAQSLELHGIAARRDPRDLRVRAWLADVHMRSGDYARALEQIDVILRLSPEARETLPPIMVRWAADPDFASALIAILRTKPAWRRNVEDASRADVQQSGARAIFVGLSASGDIEGKEAARWIDSLMTAGDWGLAYSHWASGLRLESGEALAMLYNGDFEQPPTQLGFDWRTQGRSGTYTQFEPTEGASGNAAHLVFHGRPVTYANLEQALVLPPGRYRLSMNAKGMALRADQGLRWTVTCHGHSSPLASGDRLQGSFEWREKVLAFEIPAQQCPGQWLRIDNPAPQGSARIVSGELWFDDLVLQAGALAGPPAH